MRHFNWPISKLLITTKDDLHISLSNEFWIVFQYWLQVSRSNCKRVRANRCNWSQSATGRPVDSRSSCKCCPPADNWLLRSARIVTLWTHFWSLLRVFRSISAIGRGAVRAVGRRRRRYGRLNAEFCTKMDAVLAKKNGEKCWSSGCIPQGFYCRRF